MVVMKDEVQLSERFNLCDVCGPQFSNTVQEPSNKQRKNYNQPFAFFHALQSNNGWRILRRKIAIITMDQMLDINGAKQFVELDFE